MSAVVGRGMVRARACIDASNTQREEKRAKNAGSSRRKAASTIRHVSLLSLEAYSLSNHCTVALPAATTHSYLRARQAILHRRSGGMRMGNWSLRRCRMLARMYMASPSSLGTEINCSRGVKLMLLAFSLFVAAAANKALKTVDAMLRAWLDTRRPMLQMVSHD